MLRERAEASRLKNERAPLAQDLGNALDATLTAGVLDQLLAGVVGGLPIAVVQLALGLLSKRMIGESDVMRGMDKKLDALLAKELRAGIDVFREALILLTRDRFQRAELLLQEASAAVAEQYDRDLISDVDSFRFQMLIQSLTALCAAFSGEATAAQLRVSHLLEEIDIVVVNWQYEVMEIAVRRIPRIRAELDNIDESIEEMTFEKHPETSAMTRKTFKRVLKAERRQFEDQITVSLARCEERETHAKICALFCSRLRSAIESAQA